DLLDRFRHQFVQGAANLVIRQDDAFGVEVLANLAEDVVVTDLLEIRHDDRLGIGVGLVAGEAELLRRPQAEELVATGVRLESQFLVEGELLLEAFLALVEGSHACLAVSGAAGRSHRFPTVSAGMHAASISNGFNIQRWNHARPCIAGHNRQGNRRRSDSLPWGAQQNHSARLCCAARSGSLPVWTRRLFTFLSSRHAPPPRTSPRTGATASRWTSTNHGPRR